MHQNWLAWLPRKWSTHCLSRPECNLLKFLLDNLPGPMPHPYILIQTSRGFSSQENHNFQSGNTICVHLKEIEEGHRLDCWSVFLLILWKEEHEGQGCIHHVRTLPTQLCQSKPFLTTVPAPPKCNLWLVCPLWTSVCLHWEYVQWHPETMRSTKIDLYVFVWMCVLFLLISCFWPFGKSFLYCVCTKSCIYHTNFHIEQQWQQQQQQ